MPERILKEAFDTMPHTLSGLHGIVGEPHEVVSRLRQDMSCSDQAAADDTVIVDVLAPVLVDGMVQDICREDRRSDPEANRRASRCVRRVRVPPAIATAAKPIAMC